MLCDFALNFLKKETLRLKWPIYFMIHSSDSFFAILHASFNTSLSVICSPKLLKPKKVVLVFILKTEIFLSSSCRIHRVGKEGYLIQTRHKDRILQLPEVWKSWIWRYVEVSEEVVFKNIWVFEMLNSKGLLSPVHYRILHKSQDP